jgi:hypothetical protein
MIPNIIPIHQQQHNCVLLQASVKGLSDSKVVIDTGSMVVNAVLAFSCLVKPLIDDTVLVNQSNSGYHILAVLDRAHANDMTLEFPANVSLQTTSGNIDLKSAGEINLASVSETNFTAAVLQMVSAKMTVTSGKLSSHLQEIESHSKEIKLFSESISTFAKQITQNTDVLVRWVKKVETLQIGNLIQNIRQNFTSHSKQAVITAEKEMRIDGERIHMG